MSKRRSRSGPVKIIRRFPPEPLTPAQKEALELHRKALMASKSDAKSSFEASRL